MFRLENPSLNNNIITHSRFVFILNKEEINLWLFWGLNQGPLEPYAGLLSTVLQSTLVESEPALGSKGPWFKPQKSHKSLLCQSCYWYKIQIVLCLSWTNLTGRGTSVRLSNSWPSASLTNAIHGCFRYSTWPTSTVLASEPTQTIQISWNHLYHKMKKYVCLDVFLYLNMSKSTENLQK